MLKDGHGLPGRCKTVAKIPSVVLWRDSQASKNRMERTRALVLATLLIAPFAVPAGASLDASTQVLEELTVAKTDVWAFVCEYGTESTALSCPAGTLIQVVATYFGAWAESSSKKCSFTKFNTFNKSCLSSNVSAVARACDGKASCSIPSSNPNIFEIPTSFIAFIGFDNCDSTEKYLLVTYNCKAPSSPPVPSLLPKPPSPRPGPPTPSAQTVQPQEGQSCCTTGAGDGSVQKGVVQVETDVSGSNALGSDAANSLPGSSGKLHVVLYSVFSLVRLYQVHVYCRAWPYCGTATLTRTVAYN
jgi:hypothetical protein